MERLRRLNSTTSSHQSILMEMPAGFKPGLTNWPVEREVHF
jgi:hypothetical protein